jgi:hypothetical protein
VSAADEVPNPYIYNPEKNHGRDLEDLSSKEAYQAGVSAGLDAVLLTRRKRIRDAQTKDTTP